MKQQFYSDRDMTMLTYTTDKGVMFSLCNKIGSNLSNDNYLVQCTSLGIFFNVDIPDMGVKIMKLILGEKP